MSSSRSCETYVTTELSSERTIGGGGRVGVTDPAGFGVSGCGGGTDGYTAGGTETEVRIGSGGGTERGPCSDPGASGATDARTGCGGCGGTERGCSGGIDAARGGDFGGRRRGRHALRRAA